MAEKVYQKAEITGTSTQGIDDAIQRAVAHAKKTLKGISWFEVKEIRGNLAGTATTYQVTIKVGYQVSVK